MNTITQNTAFSRFELPVDGHIAFSYYELKPGVITMRHTEVPQELSGRGIGSQLVRGALDMVRAQELRVVAKCPFVAAYIAKHPEYNDLLL